MLPIWIFIRMNVALGIISMELSKYSEKWDREFTNRARKIDFSSISNQDSSPSLYMAFIASPSIDFDISGDRHLFFRPTNELEA